MADYVTAEDLKAQAEADDASADAVWNDLASAVSRLFDRAVEVSDNFFDAVEENAQTTEKNFFGDGSRFVRVLPIVPDSIDSITIDGETQDEDDYYLDVVYLVFDEAVEQRADVVVNAKWGFPEVAADIKQACVEQAIYMWRRKDLNFAEIAGVSSGILLEELSPTFKAVTRKYRNKYGDFDYFA